MSNVLTYPELWLLELGAKNDAASLPFAWLPDTAQERKKGFCKHWNCPPHGLSGRELSEVMWMLFGRGEIEFEQSVGRDPDASRAPLIPISAAEIYEELLSDVQEYRRRRKSSQQWSPLNYYYRV